MIVYTVRDRADDTKRLSARAWAKRIHYLTTISLICYSRLHS